MLSLVFYCPDSHVEAVKAAVFAAGAGKIGLYDQCCWQTRGVGQFRPLAGASPAIGTVGALEHVHEWRVELVVDEARAAAVVRALQEAHPYDTPAFHLLRAAEL